MVEMTAEEAVKYAARIREQRPGALYRSAQRGRVPPTAPSGEEQAIARLAATIADDISNRGLVVLGARNLLELARREHEAKDVESNASSKVVVHDTLTSPSFAGGYDRSRVRCLAEEILQEQQDVGSKAKDLDDRLGRHPFYRDQTASERED